MKKLFSLLTLALTFFVAPYASAEPAGDRAISSEPITLAAAPALTDTGPPGIAYRPVGMALTTQEYTAPIIVTQDIKPTYRLNDKGADRTGPAIANTSQDKDAIAIAATSSDTSESGALLRDNTYELMKDSIALAALDTGQQAAFAKTIGGQIETLKT